MTVPFNHTEPSPFRYEPRDMREAMIFARAVVESGLAPQAKTPEAAFAMIAMGAELGLTAMQSLRSIYLIDGKPTLSADLIVGLVKRSSVCLYFRLVESDAESATYETLRRGEPELVRYTYSIVDARRAGLHRRRFWTQHPAAMLRARGASTLARMVYPDLVSGLIDGEDDLIFAASSLLSREAADLNRDEVPVQAVAAPKKPMMQGELLPDGVPPRPRRARRAPKVSRSDRSHDHTLLQAREARALELKGMGVTEAARHVAARLTDREVFATFSEAMKALGAEVEKFGVRPHEASLENILSAWLDLDSPVTTPDRAAA